MLGGRPKLPARTRLFEAERAAREQAEVLRAANLALTQTLDLDTILTTLLDSMRRLVPYDSASIMLFRDETHLVVHTHRSSGPEIYPSRIRDVVYDIRTSSHLNAVVTRGECVMIADTRTHPDWVSVPGTDYIRNWLGVPLVVESEVIGVYTLDKAQPDFFTREHARLAETMAVQAAVAIRNARLFETEARRRREAETLREAAAALASKLDLSQVLDSILVNLESVVPYDSACIYLIEGQRQRAMAGRGGTVRTKMIGRDFPLDGEMDQRLLRTGQPVFLADAQTVPGFGDWGAGTTIRGWMAFPLKVRDQIIGSVTLDSHIVSAYGQAEANLVEAFAQNAAVAIENARLFEAIRRQLEELTVLHAVAVAATQMTNEDELIERVTQIIGDTLFPDFFGVMLLDAAQGTLQVHGSFRGARGEFRQLPVPLGQGITGVVAARGAPWRVPDVRREPAYLMANPDTRSELCVPLKVVQRVLGVINVESTQQDAFGEADERLLTIVAGQLAFAIERLRAEAQREALITELEARNAELERFAYTVSHDLKSPLVTISGLLGFIEGDALSGNLDRLRSDIARIADATHKMERLLSELLELSRIGRLMSPPVEISFAAIAQEAVALVEGQLAARGVRIEIAKDLPTVHGDRARLIEVVQNLVDNAVKFMGDQPRPHIKIGMRDQDGERVFFVHDNGIGIDPRYHAKVFGLFEKLDPNSEGTGVGLALVKRIIEVHGGRVWVESEGVSKGTTFCFTLPGHSGIAENEKKTSLAH